MLAGCSSQTAGTGAQESDASSSLFAFNFGARGTAPKLPFGNLSRSTRTPQGEVFPGTPPEPNVATAAADEPVRVADASGQLVPSANGNYQLNFDNADVGAVSKAILGDILQTNYLVDKRVAGQITLTSSQPVPRARLVPLLESSLSSIGASLVKDKDLYRIVPSGDTGGIVGANGRGTGEGFGTSVISAHYMPAANLGKLLEEFGSRSGSVRVDGASNLVIVQGSSSERAAALEAANLVDVDWMRSRSVAILPVANVSPDNIIGDLNRILDSGEGGMAHDAIQLQPLNRLNAVLAVARRRDGIDLVRRWVARLDRTDPSAAGVKVYKLEYAQAKAVASMLNDLFASNGSNGSSDKDSLEPSGQGSSQTGAPAAASPGGLPASPATGQSGTQASASSGSSPFGTLKAAFATETKGRGEGEATGEGFSRSGNGATKVRVTADPTTNSLLISASAPDYKLIERAIHQMDRAPVQVDIEATIAEVTLTDDLQYGIQFYLHNTSIGAGLAGAAGLPTASAISQGINLILGSQSNPKLLLQALSSVTTVKVLSSPSLVVLDRQPAVLQVGDQVPILTRTAQSVDNALTPVVNSVDYRDTGIILNVLPRVNANGVVTLDIEQQISAVTSSDPTLTPTISQRRVRSSIAVANGQTVMLAGLISDKQTNNRSGLPGLSSVRFLNDILTTHGSARDRSEIIIFIRPQIIASSADAQQVTEEFHDRLTSMRQLAPRPIIRKY